MSALFTRGLRRVAAVGLALALMPASASADWLATPFIGAPFQGDTEDSGLTYGGAFGWMGGGLVGVELDFGVTPDFFEVDVADVDPFEGQVVTLMGNLIIGAPIGGMDRSVRPYASGGVGLLRVRVDAAGPFDDFTNDDFGFNAGAGLMGFVSDHVGLRGDIRYFRSFADPDPDLEFDVAAGDFDFWRGTAGVVFRF